MTGGGSHLELIIVQDYEQRTNLAIKLGVDAPHYGLELGRGEVGRQLRNGLNVGEDLDPLV